MYAHNGAVADILKRAEALAGPLLFGLIMTDSDPFEHRLNQVHVKGIFPLIIRGHPP